MKGLHAASFLAGAIAGGIIALLYAPQEGEKTRKQVRKFVDDGINEAGEMVQRTKEKAKEVVNHGMEQMKNGVAQARDFVNTEIEGVKAELCNGVCESNSHPGATANAGMNHDSHAGSTSKQK